MKIMNWQKQRSIFEVKSDWLDIYFEEWLKPDHTRCEYWRVEKPHSLIIIPVFMNQFILPYPQFRPGIGKSTLDFPGGRITNKDLGNLNSAAHAILFKELKISENQIKSFEPVEQNGKVINSSFNNQALYILKADVEVDINEKKFISYPLSQYAELLDKLECLQCSYALLNFMRKNR